LEANVWAKQDLKTLACSSLVSISLITKYG
jgi:hypothetical protein